MKRGLTLFLKVVLLCLACGVAVGLLWFPQTEGRAANLDLVSIYADPLIIYSYFASLPFFIGLFQAFRLLTLIDANKAFSEKAVTTLKNMKYASISMVAFIAVGLLSIRFFVHGDDPAGPTTLGIATGLLFTVIATTIAIFQKLLQNAVDLQSENDLTV